MKKNIEEQKILLSNRKMIKFCPKDFKTNFFFLNGTIYFLTEQNTLFLSIFLLANYVYRNVCFLFEPYYNYNGGPESKRG